MSGRFENNFCNQHADSITIDTSQTRLLQNLWDEGEFERIFNSPSYWTRITILGGSSLDKDVVLRSILNSVHPVEVFPALYQIDGEDSFFLVRLCSLFVMKLALTSLKVTNPKLNIEFYLTVTTNYLSTSLESLNVQEQVKTALAKRHNRLAKIVDLTNFSNDECLKEIFFHLNIPQCMHFLIDLLRNTSSPANLNKLVLQHNDLTSLESITGINHITELDLRHNKISWAGFEKLPKGMKLHAVWLDGNPLCLNMSESEYIKKLPYIRKVDGIDVSNAFLHCSLIRNYLNDGSWANFVDHFLHHYFGLMESPNRHQLARMYHSKAMFTFCAFHNPEDLNLKKWKLSTYMTNSRNLLTLSDVNKAYSTVKVGPEAIIEVLNSLPVFQFDPYSFTVDVPFSQDGMVLINVGGIFKELNSGLFYFHRSFVLTPFKKNMGEWKIENDMMSITTANNDQIERSFTKARSSLPPKIQLILNPTMKDKEALIPAVCGVTKLTKQWATRLLEEGSWDLERTLQAFIDQLKTNQIPMHAFSV